MHLQATVGALAFAIGTNAQGIFTLGYAECPTLEWFGGQPVPGERKDLFVAAGVFDVGCKEHNHAPLGVGSNLKYEDMKYFQHPVCGLTLNFYPNNGNFDFYQNNSDGTLLGTCYPHEGPTRFCPSWFGGTCSVNAMYYCYYSGRGSRPC